MLQETEENQIRQKLLDAYREQRREVTDQISALSQQASALDLAIRGLEAIEKGRSMGERVKGRPAGVADAEARIVEEAFMNDMLDSLERPGVKRSRRSGPSLRERLEDLLSDGENRTVDQVVIELAERYPNAKDKRVSVTNRLNDLTRAGFLHSPSRGNYVIAAPEPAQIELDAQDSSRIGAPG